MAGEGFSVMRDLKVRKETRLSEPKSLAPLPLELTELECVGLKPLLESNGIDALITGPTPLPNLPWQILVPDDQVSDALRVIREARLAGPSAAAEAEAAGEAQGDRPPAE
jgi:hypothetical protein